MDYKEAYRVLADQLAGRGIDVDAVKTDLKAQKVETPSWGYGDMGTRFQVFHERGTARNLFEKLTDAAQVHKLTGVCPTVAIHIPWDKVDDYAAAQQHAESLGIAIGAVNPNYFQEPEYRLGSMCHPDPAVRRQALDHTLECIEIAKTVGSKVLSLWFADGTNYPGQDSIRGRKHRMEEGLAEVYQAMPADMRMLVEYKFFEPAFYHTDIPDWGVAYTLCLGLGPRAQVLVDTGHHAQGTNIEHIVAFLIDQGKLGGFHLNNRKYADDDLITGSINPYEIFLIFNELVDGARDPKTADTVANVAYMVDQSHNIEPKIEAMLQTVINIQTVYAKALLVDRKALAEAQQNLDVLGANRILNEAYAADVRPLLAAVREEMGCPPDPMAAYKASGYYGHVQAERG
ncbi:MAG: L-rhamnose isomerase [Anaerolineae bacterium]